MLYRMLNTRTGQYVYVGDGLVSTFKSFLGKTVVGKALVGVVKGAAEKIPGGKAIIAGVKGVAQAFKRPAIAGAGGAAAGGGIVAVTSGGGGTMDLVPSAGGGGMAIAGGGGGPIGGYAGTMLPDVVSPDLLRQYYRAPRGFVIVRDRTTGNVMGVRRDIAIRNRLWSPGRKPPISAGDWNKYKTAQRVEKKLRKLASHALRKFGRRGGVTNIIRESGPGSVRVVNFKKAA